MRPYRLFNHACASAKMLVIVMTCILMFRLSAPLVAQISGHRAVKIDLSQPAAADSSRRLPAVHHHRRHPRAERVAEDRTARGRHHAQPAEPASHQGRADRLAAVIYKMQPHKGQRYAERVARLLVADARRAHVRPEVVAATAVVESHFDMNSGPCVGIMQIYRPTFRERYGRTGIDPDTLGGNIRVGASELARHYSEAVSKGRRSERARLAMMWGRYNGAGSDSGYVRRCLAAYKRIERAE